MEKNIYFFGEGNLKMKNLLGGKGAGLNEMTNLGIPVPPGFTITTEVCKYFNEHNKEYPQGLKEEILSSMKKLEEITNKKFGSNENPLLVSVRSGAAVSMPGMMDTVLNLGLNDESVVGLAKKTSNERFAYDSYRRFIQMFGNVVMGIEHKYFEEILDNKKKTRGVEYDIELTVNDLKEVINEYKNLFLEKIGKEFPQNPEEQLFLSIEAVFNSWNNERAIIYRRLHNIKGLLGTAVNVQAMVFGNTGENSGTGVCFTRNPSTGKNEFYGEFLINAQGEDVVAGIRTPIEIIELKKIMPDVYEELVSIGNKLEKHYKDMLDIEFTIEDKKLFILQARVGKRTAKASVKIAVDMEKEGLIDKKTAVLRVNPEQVNQLLHKQIDYLAKQKTRVLTKGLPASPGAAVGEVVFSALDAEEKAKQGKKVILVRLETSPEDIKGMAVSEGVLTVRGGMTSHAAVVARGMGKCCVVGAGEIVFDEKNKSFSVNSQEVKEGEIISLDGNTGEVFVGALPLVEPEISEDFKKILSLADEFRKLKVLTNADTPHDARVARDFGAQGIGLCRTEHMFFEGNRIVAVREMILSETKEERKKALAKLLSMQKNDFIGLFKVMKKLPVTIRLLDPPLHEFLPKTNEEIQEVSENMGVPPSKLIEKIEQLKEVNPMLGHRGCRLAVTFPEIYEMQAQAIIEAACELKQEGYDLKPEIMIPLVSSEKELRLVKEVVENKVKEVLEKNNVKLEYKIGTMIELPRAALTADEIAREAEFFSFGTNDLTQTTFGFSRDDVGKFIPEYLENDIIERDPFQVLDVNGVGKLVKMGLELGRKTRNDLKAGICGEHGGEPKSIEFCHKIGLDYVSCSPYRVPIARIAAAHAAIKQEE